MKGQAAIMEYMIFILLVMFIIAFVLVMIFGFQILSLGSDYSNELESRSLSVLQSMLASQIINSPQYQKGSVLDDSTLTVMTCEDIKDMLGENVYVEVSSIFEKPSCAGLGTFEQIQCNEAVDDIIESENEVCTKTNYPNCGSWKYCDKKDRMIYRSVPVNILLKMNKSVSLGVITVGIGSGEE